MTTSCSLPLSLPPASDVDRAEHHPASLLADDVPFFYPAFHDWSVFVDRLNQFCTTNHLSPERKRAFLLLSVQGNYAYQMLVDYCHPDPVTSKTYEELISAANRLFLPNENAPLKPSIFTHRCRFHEARQKADEKVFHWLNRIRELAAGCRFGDSYNFKVLDKFITGLADAEIMQKLCDDDEAAPPAATTIDLKRAVAIALNHEGITRKCEDDLTVWLDEDDQ